MEVFVGAIEEEYDVVIASNKSPKKKQQQQQEIPTVAVLNNPMMEGNELIVEGVVEREFDATAITSHY